MTESIKLSNYLTEKLIFTDKALASSSDLFQTVHEKAFDLGYVQEDFLPRVTAREATFPTGIQLENIGVAIPHTDAECILNEFVAIVINKEPVEFKSMEDIEQSVEASIVFVLGLNQPHAQLEMLQSLMGLLQNDEILTTLRQATSAEEVLTIVKQNNL
ncbi:PTS sugar transporter subunit IIA [Streptococcus sp. 20-1249]|uniref:PTS sugar transporter subunit IIA n=1 Tax=Streptococcus hepaticus TaxID=3349163 RepID=UPI00374A1FF0